MKELRRFKMILVVFLVLLSLFTLWALAENGFKLAEIQGWGSPVFLSEPPGIQCEGAFGGVGEDNSRSIGEMCDGGFLLCGWTDSFGAGDRDILLVKTDAECNLEWFKTYGTSNRDESICSSIIVHEDCSGATLAGHTNSFGAGDFDFWLIRVDSDGDIIWSNTYGGTNHEDAYDLIKTNDGGYAIAGSTNSFGEGNNDYYVVKTDAEGNMQWNRTYGGQLLDNAKSIIQTNDGGFGILGTTKSFGDVDGDFWLVKTDADGIEQWNQTYGGPDYDEARKLIQTHDEGYALAGYTMSFGAGQRDLWLVKTDSEGNKEWDKTFGGPNHDNAESLIEVCDGGYIIVGTKDFSPSFSGTADMWIVKVDSSGDFMWEITYGGSDDDLAYSVVETSDEELAVGGFTESFGAGGRDVWLVKFVSEKVCAFINIDPDTLNLKSNGQWVTAYVTLPGEYSVGDIVAETVKIAGISLAWSEIQDDIFMAKFDRTALQGLVNQPDYEDGIKFSELALTVTGKLTDGTPFEGTDTIRVITK